MGFMSNTELDFESDNFRDNTPPSSPRAASLHAEAIAESSKGAAQESSDSVIRDYAALCCEEFVLTDTDKDDILKTSQMSTRFTAICQYNTCESSRWLTTSTNYSVLVPETQSQGGAQATSDQATNRGITAPNGLDRLSRMDLSPDTQSTQQSFVPATQQQSASLEAPRVVQARLRSQDGCAAARVLHTARHPPLRAPDLPQYIKPAEARADTQ